MHTVYGDTATRSCKDEINRTPPSTALHYCSYRGRLGARPSPPVLRLSGEGPHRRPHGRRAADVGRQAGHLARPNKGLRRRLASLHAWVKLAASCKLADWRADAAASPTSGVTVVCWRPLAGSTRDRLCPYRQYGHGGDSLVCVRTDMAELRI